jgi:hypothetical protein
MIDLPAEISETCRSHDSHMRKAIATAERRHHFRKLVGRLVKCFAARYSASKTQNIGPLASALLTIRARTSYSGLLLRGLHTTSLVSRLLSAEQRLSARRPFCNRSAHNV